MKGECLTINTCLQMSHSPFPTQLIYANNDTPTSAHIPIPTSIPSRPTLTHPARRHDVVLKDGLGHDCSPIAREGALVDSQAPLELGSIYGGNNALRGHAPQHRQHDGVDLAAEVNEEGGMKAVWGSI